MTQPGPSVRGSLNLRQLRAVAVLAEELHFERASRRMRISQPAFSRLIGRAEKALGVTLFERRPVVSPTRAGETIIPEVVHALSGIRQAVSRAGNGREGETGRLTIEASSSALVSPFAELVTRFRRAHPGISIRIRTRDTADQLAAGVPPGVDLSVVRHIRQDVAEGARLIWEEPFILALPASHPLASHRRLHLSELNGQDMLEFRREVAPELHDELRRALAEAGLRPMTWVQAGDWLTVLGLVSAGAGIAVVPVSFGELAWRGVRYRPVTDPLPSSTVVALPRTARPSGPARRFLELIGESE